jgi:hypothetical protein
MIPVSRGRWSAIAAGAALSEWRVIGTSHACVVSTSTIGRPLAHMGERSGGGWESVVPYSASHSSTFGHDAQNELTFRESVVFGQFVENKVKDDQRIRFRGPSSTETTAEAGTPSLAGEIVQS